MIPEIIVEIAGEQYAARYPMSVLASIERELKKSLTTLGHDVSISDMSIIIRRGLRHTDGTPVTQAQFDAIMEQITLEEFTEIVNQVLPALFPKSSGKN